MIPHAMLKDFETLPPDAQQQVADFITFLKSRYPANKPTNKKSLRQPLAQEAFIGMWRNRQDMQDSTQWVRDLRRKEWG